ncbi:MAG: phytanoyl-CoA dioxygenase family protein [Leptospirales bacterium]|jgi:phytanoyl-CoA hydroxylase
MPKPTVSPFNLARDRERAVTDIRRDGYCVLPRLVGAEDCARLRSVSMELATDPEPPLEYEAETGYPGAPASLQSPGGKTLRRLRSIYERHPLYREHARRPDILSIISEILDPPIVLSGAHHNCVMFKDPRYGSETGWHQDMRYWRFARPELITAWLALTDAGADAGCLHFIPGSHRMDFAAERFDAEQFFRPGIQANAALLETAVSAPLRIGDVVLFHSRLLHAAFRNSSPNTRVSLIFTYHSRNNAPVPNTRSAAAPEIPITG